MFAFPANSQDSNREERAMDTATGRNGLWTQQQGGTDFGRSKWEGWAVDTANERQCLSWEMLPSIHKYVVIMTTVMIARSGNNTKINLLPFWK